VIGTIVTITFMCLKVEVDKVTNFFESVNVITSKLQWKGTK